MKHVILPNLRAEMARQGLDIPQVAAISGIEEEALSNILSGNDEFTLEQAFRIKAIFPACSYDYLFAHHPIPGGSNCGK